MPTAHPRPTENMIRALRLATVMLFNASLSAYTKLLSITQTHKGVAVAEVSMGALVNSNYAFLHGIHVAKYQRIAAQKIADLLIAEPKDGMLRTPCIPESDGGCPFHGGVRLYTDLCATSGLDGSHDELISALTLIAYTESEVFMPAMTISHPTEESYRASRPYKSRTDHSDTVGYPCTWSQLGADTVLRQPELWRRDEYRLEQAPAHPVITYHFVREHDPNDMIKTYGALTHRGFHVREESEFPGCWIRASHDNYPRLAGFPELTLGFTVTTKAELLSLNPAGGKPIS